MYNVNYIDDIAKKLTCDEKLNSKECMYKTCDSCKEKKIPLNDVDWGRQVKWFEWRRKRLEKEEASAKSVYMTLKEKEQGSIDVLHEEISTSMQRPCRHLYNIHHQYSVVTDMKRNLQRMMFYYILTSVKIIIVNTGRKFSQSI